ncbi:MAG TPA: hypothetical protein VMQ52_03190 [Candidatus Saccharimonadales bacterium]|jgi:hypothetical protein|nr:hypothetical protein [Candidatus Saccharimonadales bacterium]
MKQESLAGLVGDQLSHFDKLDDEADDRVTKYPTNYDEYLELPLESRLTLAMGMIRDEKPFNKVDGHSGERLFCFPIMDDDEQTATGVQIMAQVAYDSGGFRTLPGLAIFIETSRGEHTESARLAILEQCNSFGDNHVIVDRKYHVRSSIHYNKVLTDPKGKLFKNVVYIVDKGVAELYKTILGPRTDRVKGLGKLAILEVES